MNVKKKHMIFFIAISLGATHLPASAPYSLDASYKRSPVFYNLAQVHELIVEEAEKNLLVDQKIAETARVCLRNKGFTCLLKDDAFGRNLHDIDSFKNNLPHLTSIANKVDEDPDFRQASLDAIIREGNNMLWLAVDGDKELAKAADKKSPETIAKETKIREILDLLFIAANTLHPEKEYIECYLANKLGEACAANPWLQEALSEAYKNNGKSDKSA